MEQRTDSADEVDSCDRILPLLSESGDRRLVTEWIEGHPSYKPVDLKSSIEDTAFDVCILDTGAFQEHLPALRAKKSAASPVVLPYLLLLDESDSNIIDVDGGDLAENVVTESIDEIVTMPIQQAELHWRLAALLRLREQSLTLRQRERNLERQVDFLEKAQDIADVGAWEYDVRTNESTLTEEVYHIHDFPADRELTPEESIEHYHPDDQETIREAFRGAVEENKSYDVELRLITAEGDQRWVRTRGEPQQEDGEVVRIRGTVQDITDRKERERELRHVNQAVNASEHAIFITDTDGTITYANPAFEELTGFTRQEAIGETPAILDSGEMPEGYFEEFWETILSGETWEEEVINRRKNRETYTAHQTVAPIADDGDIEAFVAVQSDITERKQREQRLQRQSRAIAEAPVGITISNPDLEDNPLIYVNDAFVEMTGYPRKEVLGENCRFLQGENTDSERVARIREAIDDERPITIELRNYRKDGTEFWNHLEIAPVTNDEGEVLNYVGFQQDVTERRQHLQQLETIDRVLRHNLRNDMNVIRGRAELIHSKTSGEVAQSAANIIDTSDGLLETAEKERVITKILVEDSVEMEITLKPVLQNIVSTVESDYAEATIRVECPRGVTVRATERLEEALIELVENGIIHDNSGVPEVSITVTRSDGATHIEIADTGPQIPEVEQNIFEENAEQTPVYHRSGLGLWLVKLIITRSGGTTTINENTPTGNIVRITFQQ
ncbi:PAS domain-containing protein [Halopenitus sp. POP-27]|uniref:PAS domain-containing protein n=1 Tax=Halopenitus sp. POP-27 TaxID=2994425 RepID=UPI002469AB4E|nr:PAS domain-containing protein [Halopenitus sp. POP-27]